MFIEVTEILFDRYQDGESEYTSSKLVNVNDIVYLGDWSGENDEDIDGELASSIKLRTGEILIIKGGYSSWKKVFEILDK